MKLRRSRTSRRGRIEIIPMIDVMFFLLATFMLASLSMQHLHSLGINLPKGRAAAMDTRSPITLTVTRDGQLLLNEVAITLDTLEPALRPLLGDSETSVVVAADGAAPHGLVVQAMLKAREAGAEHFLIAVQHE
ncbi:MAG TPA: biopolymer transporter ExbD [Myxococcota bacterium]|nr:biopolymer transporter ExbD [Myxococcota bacterium]